MLKSYWVSVVPRSALEIGAWCESNATSTHRDGLEGEILFIYLFIRVYLYQHASMDFYLYRLLSHLLILFHLVISSSINLFIYHYQ